MSKRIILTKGGNKEYYVSNAMGLLNVTDNIKKGHILISEIKTWNPHPVPLNDTDIELIRSYLPAWLKIYAASDKDVLSNANRLNSQSISATIKYVFTHYSIEEEDVYLFEIKGIDSLYRIYIGKRPLFINIEKQEVEVNKLIYPFYDEQWNRNFYETSQEYLKMRAMEEDGYNKYFKN